MSEEPTQKTNQERIDNAYALKGITMFNVGTDNLLMIEGSKENGDSVDIILSYDFISKAVEQMQIEIRNKSSDTAVTDSKIIT
jgi:uncharacterized NAD-dependent epimerase/dehydratase family protein